MNRRHGQSAAALALLAAMASGGLNAKPIAFAHGTTVMAEYGAGTMNEAQVFYAPSYRYSLGGGYLALDSDIDGSTRDIVYARANWLAKRWNRERAQGNAFVWGGIGGARYSGSNGESLTFNAGLQLDYETRRVYASAKADVFTSPDFTNGIYTTQLGLAPYEHDYDTLATWFVVQARWYSGGIYDGTEWAFLLRLFKGNAWIEAGPTSDGKLQAMFMLNF